MENEHRFCRAIVYWKSGRIEEFQEKLKKDGTSPKKFTDKANKLRKFPTVIKVEVSRF